MSKKVGYYVRGPGMYGWWEMVIIEQTPVTDATAVGYHGA